MNRSERRKAKIAKDPTYVLKKSDIDRIKAEAVEKAIDSAIVLLFSMPIRILHDEYGWGTKKRIPEFANLLSDEYQRFSDGEMTLQEYQELVFKYCGMKFELEE